MISWSLSKKIAVVVSIPIACQTVVLGLLLGLRAQTRQAVKQVEQANAQLKGLNQLNYDVDQLMFVLSVQRPGAFDLTELAHLKQLSRSLDADVAELKKVAPDDTSFLQCVQEAQDIKKRFLAMSMNAIQARAEKDFESGIDNPKEEIKSLLERLTRKFVPQLRQHEQRLFSFSSDMSSKLRAEEEQLALIGSIITVLVSIVGGVVISRTLKQRVERLQDNTYRFSERMELHSVDEGSDELAELEKSFQQMVKKLKEKERRETLFVDGAFDGIVAFDNRYRILYTNPAFQTFIGQTQEELQGSSFFSYLKKSSHAEFTSLLKLAVDDELQSGRIESEVIRSSAGLADALLSVQWLPSEAVFYCTIRDVTAERAAEKMKAEIVEMVSHDLKTPLSTVDSLLSVLQMPGAEEKTEEYLGAARRNVKRSIQLILDFLDIEKLESKNFPYTLDDFVISDLWPELEDAVIGVARKNQVKLELAEDDDIVRADRESILRVLINLIGNAIAHSPSGARVKVFSTRMDGRLLVSVEDEGRGLEEKEIEALFTRFYQKERTKDGTGLGLTVCKYLIEQQGGQISVRSKTAPEHGAVFSFTLPLGGTAG